LCEISFSCLSSCSSDDGGSEIEIDTDTSVNVDTDTETNNDDTGTDDTGSDDTGTDDTDTGNVEGGVNTSSLTERFVFDENIYIENSYYEEECTRIPCLINPDQSLGDIFDNGNVPDEGRRIEFKQRSEGPLTTPASIELVGVFDEIPEDGMTIAQVHNRGANNGETNRPFFRLVMFPDGL